MPSINTEELFELNVDYVLIGDGSGTNRRGGWAVLMVDVMRGGRTEVFAGSVSHCTNNTMELTGFIEALAYLERRGADDGCSVLICSDSKWVVNVGKGRWTAKSNLHLWSAMDTLRESFDLSFLHFPRNSFTEAIWADRLAGEMREMMELKLKDEEPPDRSG